MINARIKELAERLAAPGSPGESLSASEFEEITDYILDASEQDDRPAPQSDQLELEILHLIIRRYGSESDISVAEALGALRMVEDDLIQMLKRKIEREKSSG